MIFNDPQSKPKSEGGADQNHQVGGKKCDDKRKGVGQLVS